ncbi:hypothetical protein [Caulobacter sp. LARHSG274]
MSAAARAGIVAKARLLDAPAAPLGPRARRLWRRLGGRTLVAPLSFDDVAALPDWASWPRERQETFLFLAAATACAPILRRTIDGKILARVAGKVGEGALDAVLSAPPGLIPDAPCEAALASDEGLRALGAAVLLADVVDRPALAGRLARLLDVEPWPLPPDIGRIALHAARGGLMALEAGATEVAR